MMNYFSALHKYDLEIRFHRRDLYQISAFCGHVFTMKLLLKKLTLGHMTENKCGYQMHIFVTSFSAQHAPAWRCFCMVQPLRQPFRPKCTNRILQMHQQNPVVPPESGVHPQNPVCTYSVIVILAWRNCVKYKHIHVFIFPEKMSASKRLTHWGLVTVTPFCDIDLGQHWLR